MVSYEAVYPGINETTFLPSYYVKPISAQSTISEIGMAVDPRTANQLGELNTKINPGVKTIEVQGITPAVWESIPEQHIDEMRRLGKLAGVTPTVHGPMIEFSGLTDKGFQEEARYGTEKQLESTMLRAQRLDPDGNISVTVHSTSAVPELRPHYMMTDEKTRERKRVEEGVWIVNKDTGQFQFLRRQDRYFPDEGKFTGKAAEFNYDKEIGRINEEVWTQRLAEVNRLSDFGETHLRGLRKAYPDIYGKLATIDPKAIKDKEEREKFEDARREITNSQIYLRSSYRELRQLFNNAWDGVKNDEDKQKLEQFGKEIESKISKGMEADPEKLEQMRTIISEGLEVLNKIKIPELWKPLETFAVDKISDTFANVAANTYGKLGEKSPILNVENPPAGQFGLSTAEDLKNLIETSRKKLAENLVEKQHMSSGEAQKVAEKLIGATWDVGHINMLRKRGYTEEDVIKQTKLIAPFVNHVHLSDNFGLDHTELPMGMGNVPLKPMMDALKKAGFKGKEIIEAGNWWQYFAQQGGGTPFAPSVEGLNSPIYSMEYGPTWAQSGRYGMYYSGHGSVNPAVHHNLYGAGFQNLPVELGGEIPGDKGRFAGTPNQ